MSVQILPRKARRTQREITWYQGVASRETRAERGWVMQDSFLGIWAVKRLLPRC